MSHSVVDQISVALFYPQSHTQKILHQELIVWLAAINVMTIAVTFLLSPAI